MKKEDANKKEKEKALKISLKESAFASSSASIAESFITPFALALKGTSAHVSILSAIGGLVAPIAQFFGSLRMEKSSRKKIVTNFVLLQAVTWLPMSLLGFLAWKGIIESKLVYILILLYTFLVIFGNMAHPAWFSWMGDIVPENHRGQYFSTRNKISGFFGILAFLIGGLILNILKSWNAALLGFSILCLSAFIFRIASFSLLKKQYHPDFRLSDGYYFSFLSFLKRLDNYGKFSVYMALFNFSIMVASPFFSVYMLKELGMENNYLLFTVVAVSSSVFYLIFSPITGKISDKYGNRPLFIIGSILFSLNPLLWIFIKSPVILIFIPQLVAGFANAAIIISTTNFTYDAVSPQHRGLCVAYTNILSGVGIFLGSLFGGLILYSLHPFFLKPFVFLFLIAAAARFSVALLLIPQIKEEKKVARLPPMHISFAHPFKALHYEIGLVKNIIWKHRNI